MSVRNFYSPVVDRDEAIQDRHRIWKTAHSAPPGVDMRQDAQVALLHSIRAVAAEFDYPRTVEERTHAYDFYQDNGFFEGLDARMWFCLARHFRPKTIVEVGGGFSSLLAADVNRRYLDGRVAFLCIDPCPSDVLLAGVPGLAKLLPFRVQDVPLRLFESLRENDVLFIDSSHVSKTGSDVNFLCLEVLPRLAPGVLVHFHDIFLPGEYPKDWVLERGYSWNEQYLVHALLIDSIGFEVVFASYFASQRYPHQIRAIFGKPCSGGGLWLRRIGSPGPK
ncbi:MAG: class I SAM-dependent methyltransferase [Vicinamibacterales bacterium]